MRVGTHFSLSGNAGPPAFCQLSLTTCGSSAAPDSQRSEPDGFKLTWQLMAFCQGFRLRMPKHQARRGEWPFLSQIRHYTTTAIACQSSSTTAPLTESWGIVCRILNQQLNQHPRATNYCVKNQQISGFRTPLAVCSIFLSHFWRKLAAGRQVEGSPLVKQKTGPQGPSKVSQWTIINHLGRGDIHV